MKNKLTKILLVSSLLASGMSFAADEGKFGLNEENTVAARKTITTIRKQLDAAVRIVEDVLYPNLQTYGINTSASTTTVLVDFLTPANGSLASSLTSSFTSYSSNPYLQTLQIVNKGLKVQAKFAGSNVTQSKGSSSAVPIFEPFIGKRIVLVPIFNVKYDASGNVTIKDQEITEWECLTDADDGISNSGVTVASGMRSAVSMGGGVLGTCQYLPSSSLTTVWSS